MQMSIVSSFLRRSGGFFLRRTFGSDRLYKVVFSLYTQALLRSGDAPMEFFIEGTRSRTAKSLHPKLGMIHTPPELTQFPPFPSSKPHTPSPSPHLTHPPHLPTLHTPSPTFSISHALLLSLGLLSMVVEPYLSGCLPDILLLPVSISYERTLEEELFARELLGTPKPKESTRVGR